METSRTLRKAPSRYLYEFGKPLGRKIGCRLCLHRIYDADDPRQLHKTKPHLCQQSQQPRAPESLSFG
jgi:hypothetical protein